MKEKLQVGDICESQSKDIYLVLRTNDVRPTSIIMLDSPKLHSPAVGKIFTQDPNSWYLAKVGDTITPLEKLIYGVDLEV